MKYRFLIALCLLTVIILNLIPHRETIGNGIIIHLGGSLPKFSNFLILCLVILIITTAISVIQLKQVLVGELVIRQIDKNTSQQLGSIFVFAIILFLLTLRYRNIITLQYSIAILSSFLLFEVILKLFIKNYHPEKLSIEGNRLIERTIFGIRKRNLETLKAVNIDSNEKSLHLKFQEGLDNLRLYFSDYSKEDINALFKKIFESTGKDFRFKSDF